MSHHIQVTSSACQSDIQVKDSALAQSKYHLIVLYIADEDGFGGGYTAKTFDFTGTAGGKSFNEMKEECYESLAAAVAAGVIGKDNIHFDVTNLKESVEFDFVECLNPDEYDVAQTMEDAGAAYEDIVEAVKQFRKKNVQKSAGQ